MKSINTIEEAKAALDEAYRFLETQCEHDIKGTCSCPICCACGHAADGGTDLGCHLELKTKETTRAN